uniref:Uncharacterized protein n=1 Tax=Trichogramma kaykai TaxID=54128 RepID=A0ABD2XQW6_9HYME
MAPPPGIGMRLSSRGHSQCASTSPSVGTLSLPCCSRRYNQRMSASSARSLSVGLVSLFRGAATDPAPPPARFPTCRTNSRNGRNSSPLPLSDHNPGMQRRFSPCFLQPQGTL